ncbi:MAG: hypothetical protein MUF14_07735 [Hyphomonadaceae bacterium]|jgi:hypothetical protein|nr:hypothetical protein [Hyphomonadaceae bacterium]
MGLKTSARGKARLAVSLAVASVSAMTFALEANPAAAQVAEVSAPPVPAATLPTGEPVAIGEIDKPAMIAGLQRRLLAAPDVRAARFDPADPDVLKIISYREFQLYLPRVEERIVQSELPFEAALDLVVQQTVDSMASHNPFSIPALRVVVRPTAAVDEFEQQTGVDGVPNRVVRRAFAPGLEEVLVADARTSIAFVPVAQLGHMRVGETDAFTWGRIHTETLARTVRFEDEDGIRIATLDGNFETSLLVLDRLWTQLADDMGGAIAVAVPTRSRLLVARTSDGRAMARLREIARAEGRGELGLSDRVYLRQGRQWVPQ